MDHPIIFYISYNLFHNPVSLLIPTDPFTVLSQIHQLNSIPPYDVEEQRFNYRRQKPVVYLKTRGEERNK